MPTFGSSPTTCPHCGKPAVVSPSKGLWCGLCRNGRKLFIALEF